MNGKIVHIAEDGTQSDVTEGVQTLYDLVTSSMNWGSGFWSYEDALPVAAIARLSGFDDCEETERYVREALHRKESDEWQRTSELRAKAYSNGRNVPHDHVWSSVGKCMWSYCVAKEMEAERATRTPMTT